MSLDVLLYQKQNKLKVKKRFCNLTVYTGFMKGIKKLIDKNNSFVLLLTSILQPDT